MIIAAPHTLYGAVGAVLSALIIVLCAVGLTLHKDFYAGVPRRDFYCYYTNLSNLLVLLYFALAAPFLYARKALQPLIPAAEYCVTMSIMLTHLVFHLMILPEIFGQIRRAARSRELRILAADNIIIHYVVPLLVAAYWLLCSPGKHTVPLWAALLWTLFPLGYALFVFLRAATGRNLAGTSSPYPYTFMNVNLLGAKQVAANCTRLYAACVLFSGGTLLLFRLLFSLLGEGHPLVLTGPLS